MREHMYRAWDEEAKTMYEENELEEALGENKLVATLSYGKLVIGAYDKRGEWRELKGMQYAGLRDKNEKRVYEGSIVKYKSITNENIGVVRFGEYEQDGSGGEYAATLCLGFFVERIKTIPNETDIEMGWSLYEPDEEKAISILEYDLEIIGDIYQNPELLEEQNG